MGSNHLWRQHLTGAILSNVQAWKRQKCHRQGSQQTGAPKRWESGAAARATLVLESAVVSLLIPWLIPVSPSGDVESVTGTPKRRFLVSVNQVVGPNRSCLFG